MLLDQIKSHVDAGGDASRGHDPVINEPDRAIDDDASVQGIKLIERAPMGRRTAAIQQTDIGQQQRARTNRRGLLCLGRDTADPVQDKGVIKLRACPRVGGRKMDTIGYLWTPSPRVKPGESRGTQ